MFCIAFNLDKDKQLCSFIAQFLIGTNDDGSEFWLLIG